MTQWLKKHPGAALGAGFGLGLLVGVGMLVGALTTMAFTDSPNPFLWKWLCTRRQRTAAPHSPWPPARSTKAWKACSSWTLLTGQLQCVVLDRRTGWQICHYSHNVINDLGVDQSQKKPQYLMVTGLSPAPGDPGGLRACSYVADANTGNAVAYFLPWNRGAGDRCAVDPGLEGSCTHSGDTRPVTWLAFAK